MPPPDTPIFVRTHDFALWLFARTAKFPKTLRASLTQRLEGAVLDFQVALARANRTRDARRVAALDEADGLLDSLRFLVRIAAGLGCLSAGQYEHAAERLTELGRLLGGWRKATTGGGP